MSSQLVIRYVQKAHTTIIAMAAAASIAAITFAHAQERNKISNSTEISKGKENNSGLKYPEVLITHHDFVIDRAHGDPPSCVSGPTAPPNHRVIDPAEPEESNPTPLESFVAGLRATGPSVILLRSGVHHLSRPLIIGAASGAVTIQPCPGETAVLEVQGDGPAIVLRHSRQVAVTGLVFAGTATGHVFLDGAEDCLVERNLFLHGDTAITLDHAQRNRIVHNVIRGVAATGIELKDGSDANLVADNVVDGAGARETAGGGIFLHGVRDNRISHNLIQQTAGFGIGILNWDDATINVGNVVEYNRLRHTVRDSADSGAVYILGRTGVDTGTVIASNVIESFGTPGNHNVGIYLDDSTNGAMVIGNLVSGPGSDAVQIHGGQDNLIENNLLDLGAGQPSAVLFQAAPADTQPLNRQTGNSVSRNLILSSNANPRPFVWYDGGVPSISDNFYVLRSGATISGEAPVADQHAIMGAAELLASDYGPAQQAAAAAIGFKPIDRAAAGVRR